MKRFVFPAILIVVAAAFAACKTGAPAAKNADAKSVDQTPQTETLKTKAGNFTVEFKANPQTAEANEPKPLKLAFYRSDAENCGGEVVLKDLHITKKLPVGKVVLIDVPTDASGEFSFACGMDMMLRPRNLKL